MKSPRPLALWEGGFCFPSFDIQGKGSKGGKGKSDKGKGKSKSKSWEDPCLRSVASPHEFPASQLTRTLIPRPSPRAPQARGSAKQWGRPFGLFCTCAGSVHGSGKNCHPIFTIVRSLSSAEARADRRTGHTMIGAIRSLESCCLGYCWQNQTHIIRHSTCREDKSYGYSGYGRDSWGNSSYDNYRSDSGGKDRSSRLI